MTTLASDGAPEITDADAKVLRMLAGSTFTGTAVLILPSGTRLDATTATEWMRRGE